MPTTKDFLSDHHVISGVYPVADFAATSVTTDYVSLENYRKVTWFIHTADATAGTADGTITVLAATAAAGTGATAIAFRSRTCLSSTTVDTWGALTARASTGFSMTAGDNVLYAVEVDAADVAAGLADADFVALKILEVTNDPIVGGILIILSHPRYPQAVPVQAIA